MRETSQPKLSAVLRQFSWTHNLMIPGKCNRGEEREFYLGLCRRERWRERWSTRELDHQIAGVLFERMVLNPPILAPLVRDLNPDAAKKECAK